MSSLLILVVSMFNLPQAQRKVSSARSDYERVQQRLMVELPQVYQGRVDFFEPCVTAALQSEVSSLGSPHHLFLFPHILIFH